MLYDTIVKRFRMWYNTVCMRYYRITYLTHIGAGTARCQIHGNDKDSRMGGDKGGVSLP